LRFISFGVIIPAKAVELIIPDLTYLSGVQKAVENLSILFFSADKVIFSIIALHIIRMYHALHVV
jgi:hypothetical protein